MHILLALFWANFEYVSKESSNSRCLIMHITPLGVLIFLVVVIVPHPHKSQPLRFSWLLRRKCWGNSFDKFSRSNPDSELTIHRALLVFPQHHGQISLAIESILFQCYTSIMQHRRFAVFCQSCWSPPKRHCSIASMSPMAPRLLCTLVTISLAIIYNKCHLFWPNRWPMHEMQELKTEHSIRFLFRVCETQETIFSSETVLETEGCSP
jgi:hypothetical protein